MENDIPKVEDYNETLVALLKQPTIASKKWVYEQYDYMARLDTVVPPGSDAGVVRIPGKNKALAMTTDCNSRYIYLDPRTGGKIVVAEAARNIVASGGEPIAVTDCLNFGSPEKPEIFWQLEQSVEGMSEACRALNTPVISGNVSLYNETDGKAIYPTPTVGMVGLITDLKHVTTQEFKAAGDLIYLVGETKDEFGGSELQKMTYGKIFGKAPELDLEAKESTKQVLSAIRAGLVASAHDISEGGFAVALAECCMSARIGREVEVTGNPVSALFSESQSRFILSVKKEHQEEFEKWSPIDRKSDGRFCASHFLQQRRSHPSTSGSIKKEWEGAIPCLLK